MCDSQLSVRFELGLGKELARELAKNPPSLFLTTKESEKTWLRSGLPGVCAGLGLSWPGAGQVGSNVAWSEG